MLWRGATSAWLHDGCDAIASNDVATATVDALLRMLYAVYAAMLFLRDGLKQLRSRLQTQQLDL